MSKSKYFSAWGKAKDKNGEEHHVTIVGKFEQKRKPVITDEHTKVEIKPNTFVDALLTYPKKVLHRKLTLGVSICHPNDIFNENLGIEIAKKRIDRGDDLGSLETSNVTMLTKDAIMGEILVKLNYVLEHIDDFLP